MSTDRSIGSSDSASLLKDGGQFGHLFQCGLWTRVFVLSHRHLALLGFHINGSNFGCVVTSLMSCKSKEVAI